MENVFRSTDEVDEHLGVNRSFHPQGVRRLCDLYRMVQVGHIDDWALVQADKVFANLKAMYGESQALDIHDLALERSLVLGRLDKPV